MASGYVFVRGGLGVAEDQEKDESIKNRLQHEKAKGALGVARNNFLITPFPHYFIDLIKSSPAQQLLWDREVADRSPGSAIGSKLRTVRKLSDNR